MDKDFVVTQAAFDESVLTEVKLLNDRFLSWPLVYLLSDEKVKEAYVGETTDVVTRLKSHLKNEHKNKLSTAHFITSSLFNKSSTLDIESNLIRYMAADGKYQPINGNLGIANHQYYQQKEVYWGLFKDLWNDLRSLGIAKHSLEYLDNSDLFKYSPYKSLSLEQVEGLKKIMYCLLDDNAQVSLIEGGAGTGKTILAIFLFKLLKTDLSDFNYSDFDETDEELFDLLRRVKERYQDLNMALVIPVSSFRKTISKVFRNIQGLNANMVIGPSQMVNGNYDLLLVDESHRLRRRVNLGTYYRVFDENCEILELDKATSSELEWAQLTSKKLVLFYDEKQSIKPSDVLKADFDKLKELENTRYEKLLTQFRVKGGTRYVSLINGLLDQSLKSDKKYESSEYDVFLYDCIATMVDDIKAKDVQHGLSRMVAGFAWKWDSNKKGAKVNYDIVIEDTKLKWNSTTEDWVNSKNAPNEVGCIHTIQGYDLNYIGVIIGPEITLDPVTNTIIVHKDLYKDTSGKNTITDNDVLHNYIINIYKTILLRGILGTYIYVCDPHLREYFKKYFNVKEKHTPAVEIEIYDEPRTNSIPYYDLEIAAGSFSELQYLENTRYIELPETMKASKDLFACKIVGESMNKVIPNGSIALFKKDGGGSRNGLICLVESSHIQDTEMGGCYTIKEYESKKTIDEDHWQHSEIILKPLSNDPSYEPIYLRDEETTAFKVLGVFVKVLN